MSQLTAMEDRLATGPFPRRWEDAICVGGLLIFATIIAFPGLGGRLLAHFDNPAHIAEIRDLARAQSNGWSDLAYAGFPLHTLQPPLIFDTLATMVRWGGALERLYEFFSVLGFVAPALAVFLLARVRLGAFWAFALASTVIFYRGSLLALDGMFSFGLASAALVLVLDLLVRPTRDLRHTAMLAALVAFIGLVHMYTTIALVYLALVHAMFSMRRAPERYRLLYDVPAFLLGMFGAAAYWLPNVLAGTKPGPLPGTSPPLLELILNAFKKVLSNLVTISTGSDSADRWGQVVADPIHYMEIFLQIVLLLLVVRGASRIAKSEDAAPRYGAALGLIIVGLVFAQIVCGLPFLGPQPFRLLYVCKLSLAVAAIPGMQLLSKKLSGRAVYQVIVCAILLAHVWMFNRLEGRQLVELRGRDTADLELTWAWLREHKQPSWGRLFMQDTFGLRRFPELQNSHILARTAEVTGVEQIGAYYGDTPYVRSEYRDPLTSTDSQTLDRMLVIMDRANATHLLLVDPDLSEVFMRDDRFKALANYGRYTIFERVGASSLWSSITEGSGEVSTARVAAGKIRLNVEGPIKRIVVKESYHPFWRITPQGAGVLELGPAGAMSLSLLPEQRSSTIELVYVPPTASTWLSLGSWLVIFAVLIASGPRCIVNDTRLLSRWCLKRDGAGSM
jgi:hypothetical protein